LSDFPDLSSLLMEGDDQRLSLDAHGYNAYFCQPKPTPKLMRLGSSTASNISPKQWQYAEQLHAQMLAASHHLSIQDIRKKHTESIVQELRKTCHLSNHIDIQLTDSGTHAHQLAMQHFCQKKPNAIWDIVMVDASETGRGVPKALDLDGYEVRCHGIAIRQPTGEPLPPEQIEATTMTAVQTALQQKHEVLIVLVDVSKTGYIAPSLELTVKLRNEHSEHVHVLLDACQFRFGYETLNHYLHHDMAVAITGSKFLAAPSFCAALLMPHQLNRSQQAHKTPKLGVLLRWHLALQSLRQLHALPAQSCAIFMKIFSTRIQRYLEHHPAFSILPTPCLQRISNPNMHWQQYPTIFPFFLHKAGRIITQTQALRLFQDLQLDKHEPVQLGRPMPLNFPHESEPLGVFRLCISAPMIIEGVENQHQESVIQQALDALEILASMPCTSLD